MNGTRAGDTARVDGLASARRLIVKVGSALLVDEASGDIRRDWLAALVEDLARCRARGQEVLLVSSGAVAVGRRHLGLVGRTLRLEESKPRPRPDRFVSRMRISKRWHAITSALHRFCLRPTIRSSAIVT